MMCGASVARLQTHDGTRPHRRACNRHSTNGDVAYSGKESEFKRAVEWLDELASIIKCDRKQVQVIRGNHDVDLQTLDNQAKLFQGMLRKMSVEDIQAYLNAVADNENHPLMQKLTDYRSFAGAYGSEEEGDGDDGFDFDEMEEEEDERDAEWERDDDEEEDHAAEELERQRIADLDRVTRRTAARDKALEEAQTQQLAAPSSAGGSAAALEAQRELLQRIKAVQERNRANRDMGD